MLCDGQVHGSDRLGFSWTRSHVVQKLCDNKQESSRLQGFVCVLIYNSLQNQGIFERHDDNMPLAIQSLCIPMLGGYWFFFITIR
jgi:hypothetical protein